MHLHSQAGGKLRWVSESAMFVPDGAAGNLTSVGACAGVFAPQALAAHAAEVALALARGVAHRPGARGRRRLIRAAPWHPEGTGQAVR